MKSRSFRFCSMLLVIVLLINMLPISVFAEEFRESTINGKTQDESKVCVVDEIVGNRTEFSKEFLLSSGLHMAVIYPEAVHFETEEGWEEIDNSLIAKSDGTLTNTAGVWDVQFPGQMSKSNAVSIEKDGHTLSFAMAGELRSSGELMTAAVNSSASETLATAEAQRSAAKVQPVDISSMRESVDYEEIVPEKLNARLTYENVFQNTNVVYDLESNKVKESVVIGAYDSALRGYRYTLQAGDMIPVLEDSGRILFYDKAQETVIMAMPAPYMVDADNNVNGDVQVQLTGSNGTYTLTYLLPRQWLEESDRSWPVILDPAVEANVAATNIEDQTVSEKVSLDYTWGMMEAGYSDAWGVSRFFIKYKTLPAITSSDVVINATLQLCKAIDSNYTAPVEAHKVNGSWSSQTITWSNKPGYESNIEDYAIVKNAGYYGWVVTDIVREWYSGENTGVMFKVSDEVEAAKTDNYKQFVSSDYGYNKPILTIQFRNNNGLESYWDYTTSSAGQAGTGYVNNFTGNMTWVRNDIGFSGNRMPVSINHVYNLNDVITPSDENNSNDSGGNSFGMGLGWRTNYNQLVYQWSLDSSYYVWEDDNGTDHYFKLEGGVYKDEDGLELTLTANGSGIKKYCITDKNGNCSYFDEYGRLSVIENNQQTKSTVTITYSEGKIHQITDGAGRIYNFIYANGLIYYIEFLRQDGTSETYATFNYTGNTLTAITQKGSGKCSYTYDNNKLLTSVADADGYKLTYTYNTVSETWQPYRVKSVSESDGSALGGSLSFDYAHNQTTITDYNGNTETYQFNDFGNTISIQDDNGNATFAKYARTNKDDTAGKSNQLILSSKMQNTVANITQRGSFEVGNSVKYWSINKTTATHSRTTEQHYIGNASLKVDCTAVTSDIYVLGSSFQIQPGQTYTFSAYVKTGSTDVCIGLTNTSTWATTYGEALGLNKDWTRIEVQYTNTTGSVVTMRPSFCSGKQGVLYIDCAQVERSNAASRFNLVENNDFSNNTAWSSFAGLTHAPSAAAPQLDTRAYKLTGSPTSQNRVTHTMQIHGNANDTLVMTGWALGDSAPLIGDRKFGMQAKVDYTDGTSETFEFSFNPDSFSTAKWQYGAMPFIPKKAYSTVTVLLVYDYNVNEVYFDGIQLYKEEFGNSYTYDDDGNVIAVKDLQAQTTTYEYDTNSNLTKIIQNNKAKMTYTYDSFHNVKTATTEEGMAYSFAYDTYGNNTAVSISSGGNSISASATYSSDGNRLEKTTDALGKETMYSYNTDTNVLEWVQYPEDTEDTRTEYSYDSMYRVATAACETDTGSALSVTYTYTDDLLSAIQTPSTTYAFTHGDFGLRTGVSIGDRTLATYSYTNDRNHYLSALDYGNGDKVQYTYDGKGRVTGQSYEDGDTVSYTYDNSSALATVTDSATGITTTYYYDLTDRLMKYVEKGSGYNHSVAYEYDALNNLTKLTETINGTAHTTTYAYDDDNRVTSVTEGQTGRYYTYDAFGRGSQQVTKHNGSDMLTQSATFQNPTAGKTTAQVATYTLDAAGYDIAYTYTYDDNGNITGISHGTNTTSYVYDSANQLIRENNQALGFTYVWEYDNAGNILSRTEYAYTTGNLEGVTPTDTVTYTYGDSNWGDLLTAYDGNTITYDQIGNPLTDGTWTYTWEHGRELSAMTDGTTTWSHTYNVDGLRTQRTNGTTTYSYVYNGGSLRQLTRGSDTLYISYDASGAPMSLSYNGTPYYYATNLQGDITAILDTAGTAVVSYTYDAWGNILATEGTMKDTLGILNPLRYRGYVYDQETGLYYLQSRYYNPEIGRFVNADGFVTTGQGILGNNMFAYCGNNPIINRDTTGTLFEKNAGGGGGYAYAGGLGVSGGYSGYVPMSTTAQSLATTAALVVSTTQGINSLRAETIAIHRRLSALERAREKADTLGVSISRSQIPQYFVAEIVSGQVVPLTPLTYAHAVTWVTSGGNLLCVNHSAAFAVVKFFPSAKWDGRHGCAQSGYLNHYHLSSAHGNHIWYLGE